MNGYRILETTCFQLESCESENDDECEYAHGEEILVYKNGEKIDKIKKRFHLYKKCFSTEQDDEFEFRLGGTDGVSEDKPFLEFKELSACFWSKRLYLG